MYLFNSETSPVADARTHTRTCTQYHFWRTQSTLFYCLSPAFGFCWRIDKTNWPKMSILYLPVYHRLVYVFCCVVLCCVVCCSNNTVSHAIPTTTFKKVTLWCYFFFVLAKPKQQMKLQFYSRVLFIIKIVWFSRISNGNVYFKVIETLSSKFKIRSNIVNRKWFIFSGWIEFHWLMLIDFTNGRCRVVETRRLK